MTDEEMSEEYVENIPFGFETEVTQRIVKMYAKQAFLAGLKAGRPEWHDLRKNPNDLPNDDRVVSDQKEENVRYVKHRNKWFYLDRTVEANVIAWCETPKYTEE